MVISHHTLKPCLIETMCLTFSVSFILCLVYYIAVLHVCGTLVVIVTRHPLSNGIKLSQWARRSDSTKRTKIDISAFFPATMSISASVNPFAWRYQNYKIGPFCFSTWLITCIRLTCVSIRTKKVNTSVCTLLTLCMVMDAPVKTVHITRLVLLCCVLAG